MLYLTSLLPTIVYLIILKLLDGFRMVRWNIFVLSLAYGIVACGVTAAIAWTTGMGAWTPILEELTKASLAIVLIRRRKIVFHAEAMVYGAAIGGGFAMAENTLYLYRFFDMNLATAIFRGFATALLHIGCTALFATLCLQAKYIWKSADIGKKVNVHTLIAASYILLPLAIHYIYNMHLMPVVVQLALTVVAFLGIFVAISLYNERRIYQWLDHSITYDIRLLAAIRQGRLTETKTGQYLLGIRSQFDAEVFFDIVCFMQLYLELVVSGKSRMLLQQEGLAQPLTPQQLQLHREKVTELHTLRKNIGKMGEYILRPVITLKDADLRVILMNNE